MANDNHVHYGGVSFFGLLAIVFITLKLCGVIDWEWWLVLAPIWVPTAIALIVLLFVFLWAIVKEIGR